MKNQYELLVGNIGYVHSGTNKKEALKWFAYYKRLSRHGVPRTRGAGEPVTLFVTDSYHSHDSILREYKPK